MRAVPIAMKRFPNLGDGYNPFWKVFFDSSVSTRSQAHFLGWDPVQTFELKDFRPFHSHNHTQCTAYACERHARTQSQVVTVHLEGQWDL
ncbi:hypothetical protein GA0115255_111306 [Streptomyces sp. Ncost-T6T-2b]|nr:hypothetical protein GA0115255_111306 [Streptomyces sp. Ncost-T6T-2b]